MNSRKASIAEDTIGDTATPEQRAQRLIDIGQWLAYFKEEIEQSFQQKISYIPDAAKLINHHYWETLEERVRPRIRSANGGPVTVDRHKICSLTELVIAHLEPIEHDDPEKKRLLSARLAYYCALNILGCWDEDVISDLFVSESFEREHLTWLQNINRCSEDFPIFSNAATWYLVEKLFIERPGRIYQFFRFLWRKLTGKA